MGVERSRTPSIKMQGQGDVATTAQTSERENNAIEASTTRLERTMAGTTLGRISSTRKKTAFTFAIRIAREE